MTKPARLRLEMIATAALVFLTLVPGASASVIGAFNLANCGGGGVTVYGPNGNGANTNLIDFLTPMFGGVGCDVTGAGTTLTYFNGASTVPLGIGTAGMVNDLSPGTGAAGFFTFPSAPSLVFNLSALGPGVADVVCGGLTIGQSCSPFAGSPFIFTATATGTALEFDVTGNVHDAGPGSSIWLGAFTTQFAGVSAAALQTQLLASGGSITSTWSGSFVVSSVITPEPTGSFMIGGGLLALAVAIQRRKRTV